MECTGTSSRTRTRVASSSGSAWATAPSKTPSMPSSRCSVRVLPSSRVSTASLQSSFLPTPARFCASIRRRPGCSRSAARPQILRASSPGNLAGLAEHPIHVTRDEVYLEVDLRACREPAQRGDFQRMRNEVHFEPVVLDAVHRKAHAIDADRAFAGDVALQLARHAYLQ